MHNLDFMLANIVIMTMVGVNILLLCKYIYRYIINMHRQLIFVALFTILSVIDRQLLLTADNAILTVALKILPFIMTYLLIYKVLEVPAWRSLFIFGLSLLMMSIAEIIIIAIFTVAELDVSKITIGENLAMYFAGNIFINVFQMILIYLIKISKSVTNLASGLKNKTYFYILLNIILTVAAITLTTVVLSYTHQEPFIIVLYASISALGLICNILSISMVLQVDFRDEKLRMQEQYNEILIDLKHKFFGMVSIIMALANNGDVEELKNYANDLDKGVIERIKNMPTNIKSNKLFYILAVKSGEAHDKGGYFKTYYTL